MFGKLEIFQLAQQSASHAAQRMSVLARNVANADTPGYKALDVAPFSEIYKSSQNGVSLRATRPGHVSGSARGSAMTPLELAQTAPSSPNGNSVSLETEMAKAASTKGQHELALGIYKSAVGIIRSSLGKR